MVRWSSFVCLGLLAVSSSFGGTPGDVDGDGVNDVVDRCSNTPPGLVVDASGRPRTDLDGDCDVDLRDFALFMGDLTAACLPEICDGRDNDCDSLVDNDAFSNDVEDCSDAEDNDCDGLVDCDDVSACPMDTPCAVGHRTCSEFAVCECAPGFDNCNDDISDGCEVDLMSDVDHCLACDRPCAFAHAAAGCQDGVCVLGACDDLWGDCNASDADGCDRALTSNTSCGACNVPCFRAHANTTCSTGECQISSCASGWGNCDQNGDNGCEAELTFVRGNCDGPAMGWAGSLCGDRDTMVGSSNTGSWWAGIAVADCDAVSVSRSMGVVVQLQSPPGLNYDLYVYEPCGTLRGSSTNGAGQLDTVEHTWPDSANVDDARDVRVEVRYVAGGGCASWTLTLAGAGS
jgi:hypothetical protein